MPTLTPTSGVTSGVSDEKCPVCGSVEVEVVQQNASYTPVYIPKIVYQIPVQQCRNCSECFSEAGDITNIVRQVYDDAHREEVKAILQWLADRGMTRAYVERKLRMPPRTLADWEENGPGPGGLMLLRFIRRDPELLKLFPGTV